MPRPKTLEALGNLATTHREAEGLSQQELADELGLPRTTVALFEQGRRLPDGIPLEQICARLRIPAHLWRGWAITGLRPAEVQVLCHFVTYYAPARLGTSKHDEERQEFVYAIKNDRAWRTRARRSADPYTHAARRLQARFPHLFEGRSLVPVPTSRRTGTVAGPWPGLKLAHAMATMGAECDVATLIERVDDVPKSSNAAPRERLTVGQHLASLRLREAPLSGVVLVDDATTLGVTMLACARLLRAAGWPGVVEGVAAAYTITAQIPRGDGAVRLYEWAGDDERPRQSMVDGGDHVV